VLYKQTDHARWLEVIRLHKHSVIFDVFASHFIDISMFTYVYIFQLRLQAHDVTALGNQSARSFYWGRGCVMIVVGVHYDTMQRLRYDCGSFLSEGQTKKVFLFFFSIHE
jgi:hypothetical protein